MKTSLEAAILRATAERLRAEANMIEAIADRMEPPSPNEEPELRGNVVPIGFMTEKQAAVKLGLSPNTLAKYRAENRIGFVKVGKRICYRQKHLDEYLNGSADPDDEAEE